ncbi:GGDEF domain-containing phosphodiesterase [Sporosarcina limicola]|uniref:PAS domain S-box-containing protein n=1 Tax=Sporosarcina limicola TaxID=34101 RepID=A0A927MR02_9BACL|nr:GGDEF domain-containing phosphodiesterase [Sporosarcina limicola]MBE1555776.1 PAS domain S-box-containing protein [Sporosarcina limicola]
MNTEIEQSMLGLPGIMKGLEQFYMVTRVDSEGSIIYVNKNFLETSRWTPKRVIGKSFWQMFADTEKNQEQAYSIWKYVSSGKTWFGTVEKITRSGESYYVNMIAIPFMKTENQPISVTFLELDITADVQLRDKLQQIAFIDFETGLMSRHKLEVTVNEAIDEGKHFSFVYITIDHYYTLKDLQTYESEKELIKSFINRLKRFFQDNPIARVGVNEFVVLSPFGDWYVQGFHQFLEQQPIYIDNTALPLSVSGGIVRYPEDQQTFNHLMKVALAATKDIVENGGGKITSLSPESHKELNRRAIIDRKLLIALNHHNLQVVYQPLFDVASGEVNMYEALVRWEDDELGFITPDELIPIAEENGLIHEIGTFVLEEAAKLATDWDKKGHPVSISVNSSVREFSNSRMRDKIIEILRVTGCPANRLQLEITEKFAFQAEEEQSIVQQMTELQDVGIEFTLDDFGTGYASFRYMQHLPISKIKIDKLFIQSLMTQSKTQQLVEGMIRFGKSMGLYVVAEGVETEGQFELLISMGVDAIQGYYIGIPLTAESITFE